MVAIDLDRPVYLHSTELVGDGEIIIRHSLRGKRSDHFNSHPGTMTTKLNVTAGLPSVTFELTHSDTSAFIESIPLGRLIVAKGYTVLDQSGTIRPEKRLYFNFRFKGSPFSVPLIAICTGAFMQPHTPILPSAIEIGSHIYEPHMTLAEKFAYLRHASNFIKAVVCAQAYFTGQKLLTDH